MSEMENSHVLFDPIVLYRQHAASEGERRLFQTSHTVAYRLRARATKIIILKGS
jgi:hypothetical protein